jgi:hypothetical protein
MKVCICGIGGAGGKIAKRFLQNTDLNSRFLSYITGAECVSPGKMMGIWLDADKDDAKSKQHYFKDLTEGSYPGFFIPHDVVPPMSNLHKAVKAKYGYNVKKQGFVRDAQYLKAIFEIFDSDDAIQKIAMNQNYPISKANRATKNQSQNPIFDSAWDVIEPYTIYGEDGECDILLFIVSFGGGTGTGFINPIVDHIRKSGAGDFPVFVLGVLTEPGDRNEGGQFSKEGQRYLAAISALYDLLTKKNGANGVILVDNEIMKRKAGEDYDAQNEFLYRLMKPMVADRDYPDENPVGQAIEKESSRGLNWSPIFVPAYWTEPRKNGNEGLLVERALKDGILFDCTPSKADKAFVFCRGFVDSNEIIKALSVKGITNVQVFRKLGEDNDEILILLRNPYGGDPEACERDGTLEKKLCKIITSVLRYMNENVGDLFYEGNYSEKAAETEDDVAVKLTKLSRDALLQFFFGKEGYIKDHIGKNEGFAYELREARSRLKAGKNPSEEPVFCKPLRIFKKGKSNQLVFCWDKIPEKDNGKLIEFLIEKYGIDWAKNAEIEKIEDGKTIQVCTEKNSLFLVLNSSETESILIIDDCRIDKLIAAKEKDELNIYESGNGEDESDENGTTKINQKLVNDLFEKKFKEMLERPEFKQKFLEIVKAGN